ncbi:MAG: hypothetical protein KZQ90_12090 [Candidatus Thiodiazotropha sp. (ex Codakia rugifera)]|nr:hypothetical protein [Candidatus Thiodiazotropha sp. (ex Codakia rugifera)]
MELNQVENLFAEFSRIVDYPFFEDSPRIALSATLAEERDSQDYAISLDSIAPLTK